MSNIGIMDGAFFVGRKEILEWVNRTLALKLAKIEDTAFGGVAIQMVDIMYPGQVPVHQINWGAKQSFEFVGNYKVLQKTFAKLKVDRFVDVDKLIKGKYQDNLEFMQWLKRFFEMSVSEVPADYDPIAQRLRGKGGAAYEKLMGSNGVVPASAAAPTRTAVATSRTTTRPGMSSRTQKENKTNPNPAAPSSRPSSSASVGVKKSSTVAAIPAAITEELASLKVANEAASRTVTELKQEMDGLEKERDFYFDKLRDIEMMLQDKEDAGSAEATSMSQSIFKILYATADGFEQTGDEAAVAESTMNAPEPAAVAEMVAPVE